jgi:hypothetical protein
MLSTISPLDDWELCLSNVQCFSGCCSSFYSLNDVFLRCTPQNKNYRSDICFSQNELQINSTLGDISDIFKTQVISDVFSYDSNSYVIKFDQQCISYDFESSTRDVNIQPCHNGINQQWYYNEKTRQLVSFFDRRCLDLNQTFGMNECHDGNSQKFDIPFQWQHNISVENRIRTASDITKCINVHPETNLLYLDQCKGGSSNIDQIFFYDHGSSEIVNSVGGCLTMLTVENSQQGGISECHEEFLHQKWVYDNIAKQIRCLHDSMCLDVTLNGSISVVACSDNMHRFEVPASWNHVVSTCFYSSLIFVGSALPLSK